MNWIDFNKERPKAEPVRIIKIRSTSWGAPWTEAWSDNEIFTMINGGFWAEIEGPTKPLTPADAARAIQFVTTTEWPESKPPPKPDPFEEFWIDSDGQRWQSVGGPSKDSAKRIWDAAIKYAKGER